MLRRVETGRKRDEFEYTTPNPPMGLVSSFLYFMRGKKPVPKKDKSTITLRVEEQKLNKRGMLIRDAKLPVDENELLEIAYLYIKNLPWTRDNTITNTSLSQGKHNTLTQRFLHLKLLENVGTEKKPSYRLTNNGKWFLRAILPDTSTS